MGLFAHRKPPEADDEKDNEKPQRREIVMDITRGARLPRSRYAVPMRWGQSKYSSEEKIPGYVLMACVPIRVRQVTETGGETYRLLRSNAVHSGWFSRGVSSTNKKFMDELLDIGVMADRLSAICR